MKPRTILILSTGPTSRNPRAYKEAVTLGKAGHDVTLMTIANQARFEPEDQALLEGAPFQRVILDRLDPKGVGAFVERFGTWFWRRAVRWGWESASALGPARALDAMAAELPADLTIVHTELPLVLGARMAARGRRVAADFEDWHSQDLLPKARRTRPLRLLSRAEGTLLRMAAYVSTTSRSLADALAAAHGSATPLVLTNSFPLQPAPRRAACAMPSLLWFSQTVGPGRGIEEFLAGWARTSRPSRLSLLGDIAPDYRKKLEKSVPPGKSSHLQFLPIVPPRELPALIATHDVGLALEASSPPSRNLTITNKILQYFNAGLGVVATGTAGQREALARAPGAGIIVDVADPDAVARSLDPLLADAGTRTAMGAAARAAAENRYCWEREEPRLLAAVESALASPPA